MQILTDKIRSLKSAIQSGTTLQVEGLRQATIISVCSQKGGVGKTTTAVNLAFTLSLRHGKHVLVLDLDPQGHIETSVTTLVPNAQHYRPVSTLLLDKKPNLMEAIVKTEFEGFDITPG